MAGAVADSKAVRPSVKSRLVSGDAQYRLGRVQRTLHALTSLARADQVADGEADHYFHAYHFLPGAGALHFT